MDRNRDIATDYILIYERYQKEKEKLSVDKILLVPASTDMDTGCSVEKLVFFLHSK